MGARILIVDDDGEVREAIAEVLADHAYKPIEAANGEEALECLRASAEKPCVILLDLMMPVMDGWQFRAAQIDEPDLSRIPVVVLTAHANAKDASYSLQAAGFLKKPVQLETLLACVERFCPRRNLGR